VRIALTASIAFLTTSVPGLHGASILNTFCSVDLPGGTVAVNSTADCNVMGAPVGAFPFAPFAEAHAGTDYGFEPFLWPDGSSGESFYASVSARSGAGHLFHDAYSHAEAYAELSLGATTAGPVRPGLIDVAFFGRVDHADGFGRVTSSIGSLFAEIPEPNQSCSGACGGTFPFVLGQPFDIHLVAFTESWATDVNGLSFESAFGYSYLRLRELDGTPTDLFLASEPPTLVPEPSSWLMLAPALLILLVGRLVGRYVRRNRCVPDLDVCDKLSAR
jgi:hypothetical protein